MRPWTDPLEMDEFLVSEWNKVVRPKDKVYHLGDVAMRRKDIATVGRCNGHKRLVRGNHDDFPTKYYLPFFEEIYGVRVFEDMIFSHMPLEIQSIKRKWTNVHGHVHNNVPDMHLGPKYLNVSVEVTGYRPLSFEEVRARIRAQQDRMTASYRV